MPLMKNAGARPSPAMTRPATAGPTILAVCTSVELRATALTRSSRPTISMTKVWRAGMSSALVIPSRRAKPSTCHGSTTPDATSTASAKARTIAIVWVAAIVGRFGSESATIPPNRPSTSRGPNWAATSRPSMNGSLVRVRTSHACAARCMWVPMSETSWPVQ
jgi:hypothetical protein